MPFEVNVFGLTVMVIVCEIAHCPVDGVNVYVVVIVLFNSGDQVPVIPLVEVVGRIAKLPPEKIGAACVNAGVTGLQKVKPVLAPVPLAVVTLTLPLVPLPTTAVMVVAFTTVNEVAAVPPKLTAVAPVKFVPVMVTVEPVAAVVGVKDVSVGVVVEQGLVTLAIKVPCAKNCPPIPDIVETT